MTNLNFRKKPDDVPENFLLLSIPRKKRQYTQKFWCIRCIHVPHPPTHKILKTILHSKNLFEKPICYFFIHLILWFIFEHFRHRYTITIHRSPFTRIILFLFVFFHLISIRQKKSISKNTLQFMVAMFCVRFYWLVCVDSLWHKHTFCHAESARRKKREKDREKKLSRQTPTANFLMNFICYLQQNHQQTTV